MVTLTPAYGRDYKTVRAIIADYVAGKDFILNDITHRRNGSYCSCEDFKGRVVTLRYNKLRCATVYDGNV